MSDDLITVVVPVYNVEKYLKKSINSILKQTYKSIEIILVDDGSTDLSYKICDEYAELDGRVSVIHKENGGLSSARNAGIDKAHGKYICFFDSDDYIKENMLELLYNSIVNNDADMSVCNYAWVNEEGMAFNTTSLDNKTYTGKKVLEEYLLDDFSSWVIACNKMYSIDLFQSLRYPVGKINEDSFIIHHLLYKCEKIACISDVLYMYLQRTGSITKSGFKVKNLDVVDSHFERANFYLDKTDIVNNVKLATKATLKGLYSFHSAYYGVKKTEMTEECFSKNKIIQNEFKKLYKKIDKTICSPKDKLLLCMCNIDMFITYKIIDKISVGGRHA